MKSLSLLQPWATLVMLGIKRCDLRDWKTRYRGRLAIHAGCKRSDAASALCRQKPYRSWLDDAGIRSYVDLPFQVLLGTVELVDCLDADELANDPDDGAVSLCSQGRWAWIFDDPRRFDRPIPFSGRPGIFNVPDEVIVSAECEALSGGLL